MCHTYPHTHLLLRQQLGWADHVVWSQPLPLAIGRNQWEIWGGTLYSHKLEKVVFEFCPKFKRSELKENF